MHEVAVLRNPKHGYIGNSPLPGGEFRLEVGPPVDGVTRLAYVDCQLPKCGMRSRVSGNLIDRSAVVEKEEDDGEKADVVDMLSGSQVPPEKEGEDKEKEENKEELEPLDLDSFPGLLDRLPGGDDETEKEKEDEEDDDDNDDDDNDKEDDDDDDEDDDKDDDDKESVVGATEVRIVGGHSSPARNWPSVVGLYRDGVFSCGAAVLSPEWVATAAHCVKDFSTSRIRLQVQAGMLRKSSLSPYQYFRNVSEVHMHPGN